MHADREKAIRLESGVPEYTGTREGAAEAREHSEVRAIATRCRILSIEARGVFFLGIVKKNRDVIPIGKCCNIEFKVRLLKSNPMERGLLVATLSTTSLGTACNLLQHCVLALLTLHRVHAPVTLLQRDDDSR